MEMFEQMEPLLRAFWWVAIPASLVFLIQTVMTFMGTDSADGTAADFDGDLSGGDAPFQLFSLRNMVNFLLGFSWTGISLYNSISSHAILLTTSVVVGVLFVFIFFIIIRQVQRLAEDNTITLASTMNQVAEVYLTIPPNMSGRGKVLISIRGSFHELDAMTENGSIPSGATVRVARVENESILIVVPV
jgi:hypothetical protein